jgi:hypothetical protein
MLQHRPDVATSPRSSIRRGRCPPVVFLCSTSAISWRSCPIELCTRTTLVRQVGLSEGGVDHTELLRRALEKWSRQGKIVSL